MSASLLKDLALPEFSSDKAPQFTTPETCKTWIKAQPIANAPQAQLRLRYQLESFNRYALPDDPAAASRLEILDQLRVPVLLVQAECAKRFTKQNLPLPLSESEQTAFGSEHALWQALSTGYLQVLRLLFERSQHASLNETECDTAARAARCVLSSARSDYLFHLHAGFLPEARFWRRLHQTQRLAEAMGVSQRNVANKSSAAAVYVEVLLLSMASLYQLSSKQRDQIAYWAQRWASRVSLLSHSPEDLRTPSIVIDVLGDHPPVYANAEMTTSAESTARWLDLRDLRKTIKQRLLKLAEGSSPQALHLGDICDPPECEELLEQVYRDWCKGGRPSNTKASGKSFESCEWVMGVDAIYQQLGGLPIPSSPSSPSSPSFPSPRSSRAATTSPYQMRRSHEEIAVLGDVMRHGIENETEKGEVESAHVAECWQVLDENLHEIFLQCPLDPQRKPLRAGQLLAVRLKHHQAQQAYSMAADDRAIWQLARICWVMIDLDTTQVRVAIHLFPGVPCAVQLFIPAHAETKAQTMSGLCLPDVRPLDQPATVLMPLGEFSVDRVMEVRSHDDVVLAMPSRIRLIRRLDRGADFERCTYEAMM